MTNKKKINYFTHLMNNKIVIQKCSEILDLISNDIVLMQGVIN